MPSRRLLLVVIAGATLFAAAASIRYVRYGGAASLTGFGCIPNQVCFARLNARTVPPRAVIYETGGYDGQFFYYIAADLYSNGRLPGDARVDASGLRWSRIGLPVMAGWGYLFGPRGLVISILLVLLGLHLWAIFELHRIARAPPVALWMFALNPFPC